MAPSHSTVMNEPLLAGVSDSSKKKKIFFMIFASILLITAGIGLVVGVNSKTTYIQYVTTSDNIRASTAHTIVKSSCGITIHPDLCYSTLSNIPEMTEKVKTSKDVIKLALRETKNRIEKNHFVTTKLTVGPKLDLTKYGKIALHDCLEMDTDTLYELNQVIDLLETYPPKKGIRRYVDDIITHMSTAMTFQDTCIDFFSHDEPDRHLVESLIDRVTNARKMCSISLALIKIMTDTDMADQVIMDTRKSTNEDDIEWPEWLSEGDRRLLQSETVTPNVTVAADGSGNFTTVSAAVDFATNRSRTRFVIWIKEGVYYENMEIESPKWNLMFVGSGQNKTTITGDLNYGILEVPTFHNHAVAAVGQGFLARDITFQNTAGPDGRQAVALRVGSDFSAFYRCGMLGYQDTLYVHVRRQFFVQCYIAGTIDFIFGNGAAILQDCDIDVRRPNPRQNNMITAQSRTDPNQNTGIVIKKSRIRAASDLVPVQANFSTYFGRPWREVARVVVMQSEISDVVHPLGWSAWVTGDVPPDTVYYGEYNNTGDGADTSGRVTWPMLHLITDEAEVEGFTPENFIDGGDWLEGTGFPYSLGL